MREPFGRRAFLHLVGSRLTRESAGGPAPSGTRPLPTDCARRCGPGECPRQTKRFSTRLVVCGRRVVSGAMLRATGTARGRARHPGGSSTPTHLLEGSGTLRIACSTPTILSQARYPLTGATKTLLSATVLTTLRSGARQGRHPTAPRQWPTTSWRTDRLTQMKLHRLVYYAHGWHLGFQDTPLLNETLEAWPYGPVVPSILREFGRFGAMPIDCYATMTSRASRGSTLPTSPCGTSWPAFGRSTATTRPRSCRA